MHFICKYFLFLWPFFVILFFSPSLYSSPNLPIVSSLFLFPFFLLTFFSLLVDFSGSDSKPTHTPTLPDHSHTHSLHCAFRPPLPCCSLFQMTLIRGKIPFNSRTLPSLQLWHAIKSNMQTPDPANTMRETPTGRNANAQPTHTSTHTHTNTHNLIRYTLRACQFPHTVSFNT